MVAMAGRLPSSSPASTQRRSLRPRSRLRSRAGHHLVAFVQLPLQHLRDFGYRAVRDPDLHFHRLERVVRMQLPQDRLIGIALPLTLPGTVTVSFTSRRSALSTSPTAAIPCTAAAAAATARPGD